MPDVRLHQIECLLHGVAGVERMRDVPEDLHVGVSTRGAISLYRASQASALIDGRSFVVPDDVKQLTIPVLSHRVVTKGFIQGDSRMAAESIIERLVDEVAVPT